MSDYTLAVSWSGKDALADSDAGKVISGADFNSEFTTIQTALNSKADIASETLTGTPLAPTAAADTNTIFRLVRDTGTDTNTGDLRLVGIKIFFTTDAANDA